MPGARTVGNLLNATPGLTVDSNGLNPTPTMTFFSARGGQTNEGRMTVNGLTVAAAFNGGGVSSYILDTVNSDEVSVTVSGGMGESDTGGPVMNLVPRAGGNQFRGSAFYNNAGDWSRGDNINDELRAAGITETPGIIKAYDASVSYGGPIKRDRLWFYGSIRQLNTETAVEGIVANANAGNLARWDWVRDDSLPARQTQGRKMYIGRATAQVTAEAPHQLLARVPDALRGCAAAAGRPTDGCHTRGARLDRLRRCDDVARSRDRLYRLPVLPDAGTVDGADDQQDPARGGVQPAVVRSRRRPGPAAAGRHLRHRRHGAVDDGEPGDRLHRPVPRANYVYRALSQYADNWSNPNHWRASASYVTGSHNMKVGYQGSLLINETSRVRNPNAARVPLQSGRAQPGQRGHPGLADGRHDVGGGVLRAGHVDARPADAAGRAALRPRLELEPGR